MNYYRLYIHCKNEEVYHQITEVLLIEPTIFDNENSNEIKTLWCYAIDEKDEDDYVDYINIYLDLIEPKFSELERIGIETSDISIWRIYEYQHQCSMEITPQEMRRLGNNGITLCIDCFEK